jgi:hypothetical protein
VWAPDRAQNGGSRAASDVTFGILRRRSAWPECDQADACRFAAGLSSGSGLIGSVDVGGVPVKRCACPVESHGAWVGVRGGFLNVAQRDTGVQRGGDECVPEGVRSDGLGDIGPPGYPADDPPGALPVEPPAIGSRGDRRTTTF